MRLEAGGLFSDIGAIGEIGDLIFESIRIEALVLTVKELADAFAQARLGLEDRLGASCFDRAELISEVLEEPVKLTLESLAFEAAHLKELTKRRFERFSCGLLDAFRIARRLRRERAEKGNRRPRKGTAGIEFVAKGDQRRHLFAESVFRTLGALCPELEAP